jgi:hypothetical protein
LGRVKTRQILDGSPHGQASLGSNLGESNGPLVGAHRDSVEPHTVKARRELGYAVIALLTDQLDERRDRVARCRAGTGGRTAEKRKATTFVLRRPAKPLQHDRLLWD